MNYSRRSLLTGALLACGSLLAMPARAAGAVSLVADPQRRISLDRRLYGFDTNMLSAAYGFEERTFIEAAGALAPGLLRFPGGEVANFYHWQKGGFVRSELQKAPFEPMRRRLLQNNERLGRRYGGQVAFDAFMAFCARVGAEPLLVVNPYTGTPEESAAWVRYVRERGYKIAAWELGNEPYIRIFWKDRFPDARAYLEIARAHARAMRAADPNIRLLVAAAPAEWPEVEGRTAGEYDQWNRTLASADFYDGYSIHLYAQRPERVAGNLQAQLGQLFGAVDIGLPQVLASQGRRFGNRPAWITEWNLSASIRHPLLNTQAQALYSGNFLIALLENQQAVGGSTYHNLASGGPYFSAFSPPPGNSGAVARAAYPVFQLVGRALAGASSLFPLKSESPGAQLRYDGTLLPAIRAIAIGDSRPRYLLVANRASQALPVRLQVGREIAPLRRLRYIAAADLRTPDAQPVRDLTSTASGLELPAYSFGIVELT